MLESVENLDFNVSIAVLNGSTWTAGRFSALGTDAPALDLDELGVPVGAAAPLDGAEGGGGAAAALGEGAGVDGVDGGGAAGAAGIRYGLWFRLRTFCGFLRSSGCSAMLSRVLR